MSKQLSRAITLRLASNQLMSALLVALAVCAHEGNLYGSQSWPDHRTRRPRMAHRTSSISSLGCRTLGELPWLDVPTIAVVLHPIICNGGELGIREIGR